MYRQPCRAFNGSQIPEPMLSDKAGRTKPRSNSQGLASGRMSSTGDSPYANGFLPLAGKIRWECDNHSSLRKRGPFPVPPGRPCFPRMRSRIRELRHNASRTCRRQVRPDRRTCNGSRAQDDRGREGMASLWSAAPRRGWLLNIGDFHDTALGLRIVGILHDGHVQVLPVFAEGDVCRSVARGDREHVQ